ncbi:MAG: glycosyltransferase [Planctomycetota bacterium]
MRCLLLADGDIALRESALLHRLVIGLLDAGVHVAHAAPDSVLSRIEPSLGVEILPYRASGFPWTRSMRAGDLLERFETVTAVSSGDPGLVHVFGSGSLALGADIARAGELALVVDVHARAMIGQVRRLLGERFEGVLLAGSRSIADGLLAGGVAASGVRDVGWGVTPVDRRHGSRSSDTISIAIGGRGDAPDQWERCLRGLAHAAADKDNIAVFADADACERAKVGPLVAALGLSPVFSRVPDFEARRDLIVQADLLLWPERLGEVRSIVLDAMANRTPVVALDDPDVPAIGAPGGALEVAGQESSWSTAIERLVGDDAHRSSIGEASAEYVRTHHSAAAHVGAVVDAYEWATSSFSRSGSRSGGER